MQSSVSHRVARILSVVLVPPVIAAAVFTVLTLQHAGGNDLRDGLIWLVSVLCSGGLQIAYVLTLHSRGSVTDWDVPRREQRSGPYLVSIGISIAGAIALALLDASWAHRLLMWCFAVNTAILTLINLRWKISAHTMGFAGPPVMLWDAAGWWLLLLLLPLVALAWARVRLGSHSIAQTCAGAALGAGLVAVQLFLFHP